jgi:hypothetical protein
MTTTIIPFVPSQVQAPQFIISLSDGNSYSVTVLWNLFGQRYYISVQTLGGDQVLYTALVGSPVGINVQSASWLRGTVTLTTLDPHGVNIGSSADLTITGMVPDAYNGLFECLATSRYTLSYSVANNPGAVTVLGSVQENIDLLQGLYANTLIYRAASSWFEVS